MKNNIVLIGFMGCGKSSVGIRLSGQLRCGMTDTDQWIEKKQGMSISGLFEAFGETAFRGMETECLKELIRTQENGIISTGGGLPMQEINRPLLKELGKVYYLKATPEVIYERLKGDDSRPLLRGKDPMGRITELLGSREAVYEQCADVIIEVSGKSFDEITRKIKRELPEGFQIQTDVQKKRSRK